jgi:outer membrane protein OmpA-like peptidoglycan-associated protein
VENIHTWNEECRRRTGYQGEDITTDDCASVNLQRKEAGSEAARSTQAETNSVQEVLLSPGQPLEPRTRNFMEERFGDHFDSVRVHTDGRAAESAQRVNALAFTAGNHVVFGGGQYTPEASGGKHLIAHELAHVVQQRKGVSGGRVQRKCGPKEVGPAPSGCEIVAATAKTPIRGERFFFQVNCDEFAAGEDARLQAFLDPAKITSGANITIRGMASADGSADFNRSLSCNRAAAAVAVLNQKGFGPNIKSVSATGGIPGTTQDPKFRAVEVTVTGAVVPSQGPTFSIVGNPVVTAVVNPSNASVIDTFQVNQAMGDFDLAAVVSMQAPQASDFDDWQIGAVQTAVTPAHQRCFKFPAGVTPPPAHQHPNEVFVAHLQGLPGPLIPDRDDSDPIFMSVKFKDDLATLHHGRTSFTFGVKAHDTPSLGGRNGLFNITNDPLDGQSLVFREHKFLFALTHVIARQKSSGRVIPLYTAEWFTFWDIAYDPSAGTGIPPVEHVLDRRFQRISDHRFGPTDQAPIVGGKAIRSFSFGGQYQASCPSL